MCYVNSAANDSIVVLQDNNNTALAVSNPDTNIAATFTISTGSISGGQQIGNYYCSSSTNQSTYWYANYIVNNSDIVSTTTKNTFPHPNPFYTRKNAEPGTVYLPLDTDDESTEADLYIYDISMHLMQVLHKTTVLDKQFYVIWKPLTDMSKRIGSGVYIYQIKTVKKSITGKITVIND